MATIQLRVRQQAVYNLGGMPTTTNAFVLRPVRYSTIDHETFINYCATNSTVPRASLRASLEAIISGLEDLLLNGHSVSLDGLGTFSLSATTRAQTDATQAGSNQLCRLHIRFRASKRLKRKVDDLCFTLDGVYEIAGLNDNGTKFYRRVTSVDETSTTSSTTADNTPQPSTMTATTDTTTATAAASHDGSSRQAQAITAKPSPITNSTSTHTFQSSSTPFTPSVTSSTASRVDTSPDDA